MKVGDHILQIGDVNLRGMGSEQVAQVLRNQGTNSVNLILARPIQELPPDPVTPSLAPIVPTRIISDVNETQRQLAVAAAAVATAASKSGVIILYPNLFKHSKFVQVEYSFYLRAFSKSYFKIFYLSK